MGSTCSRICRLGDGVMAFSSIVVDKHYSDQEGCFQKLISSLIAGALSAACLI